VDFNNPGQKNILEHTNKNLFVEQEYDMNERIKLLAKVVNKAPRLYLEVVKYKN
jgi:hypothetical protein